MNYQHLQYFQAVARRENYQVAAQDLFISQSALSRAIANLESELGVSLFEKQGRNIKITPFGKKFLEYVDKAVDSIEEGMRCLRDMATVMEGNIQIAAIYGLMYNRLPKILDKFTRQYPNVTFCIKAMVSADVLKSVNCNQYDVGFLCGMPQTQYYPDLDFLPISTSELVIITSNMHPLAKYDKLYLKDIIKETFVSFDKDAGTYKYVKNIFSFAKCPFQPKYTVSDDQSVFNVVQNNLAISCVHLESICSAENLHVIHILDDMPDDIRNIPIYVTTKKKQSYPLALLTFLEMVCHSDRLPAPV